MRCDRVRLACDVFVGRCRVCVIVMLWVIACVGALLMCSVCV